MTATTASTRAAEAGTANIPMLIGGEWRSAAENYEVRDPYRNTVVANAPRSALNDLNDALDAAVGAKAKAAAMRAGRHPMRSPLTPTRWSLAACS